MRLRRAVAVPIIGGLAAVVGFGSTAWGCFVAGTEPYVSISDSRAPAGSRVTVTGANWAPNSLSVHWITPTGRVLKQSAGSAANGSFSAVFAVPDESPGVYYAYVVQEGSPTKALAVEIVAPHQAAVPQAAGPAVTANATSGGAAPARQAAPTAGQATPADAGLVPEGASSIAIPASAPTAGASQPTSRAKVATATIAAPRAETRPGSGRTAGLPAGGSPAPVAEEEKAAVPSARSATGELWPGFADGTDSVRAPSLQNLPGAGNASSPNQAPVGVSLLVLGAMALFAGFGIAEVQRRKAAATSVANR